MKTFTIKARVLRGNSEFIRGRIVGIINAIAGACFVEALHGHGGDYDPFEFAIETTEENYLIIREKLESMLHDEFAVAEFEF